MPKIRFFQAGSCEINLPKIATAQVAPMKICRREINILEIIPIHHGLRKVRVME